MKNLEQLMASFLCRKDFLDPEGTKMGKKTISIELLKLMPVINMKTQIMRHS